MINKNYQLFYWTKNSEKEICQRAEATGEFIGSKIAEKIGKPKLVPNEKSRNTEEIVIPP